MNVRGRKLKINKRKVICQRKKERKKMGGYSCYERTERMNISDRERKEMKERKNC